jgi:hypothetical protein
LPATNASRELGYGIAWGRVLRLDKEFRLNIVLPFGADGDQAVHYQEAGINQLTVVKKARADRVKLLLGVLNWRVNPCCVRPA